MRHRVAGRKLGRTSEHRVAMLRNLSTALFDKERIKTTLAKAKELRPFAEKLLTLSKKETLHARRRVMRHIHDRDVVSKLFDTLSARFAQRPGGYTRIVRLGPRRGDHAEMALIELVGTETAAAAEDTKGKAKAAGDDEDTGGDEAPRASRRRTAKKAAGKKAAKKVTKKTAKKSAAAEGSDKPKKKTAKKTAKKSAKKTAAKSTAKAGKKTAKKTGKKTAKKAKSTSRKRGG